MIGMTKCLRVWICIYAWANLSQENEKKNKCILYKLQQYERSLVRSLNRKCPSSRKRIEKWPAALTAKILNCIAESLLETGVKSWWLIPYISLHRYIHVHIYKIYIYACVCSKKFHNHYYYQTNAAYGTWKLLKLLDIARYLFVL